MAKKQTISPTTLQKARKANVLGLQHYERWDIDEAIKAFNDRLIAHLRPR